MSLRLTFDRFQREPKGWAGLSQVAQLGFGDMIMHPDWSIAGVGAGQANAHLFGKLVVICVEHVEGD